MWQSTQAQNDNHDLTSITFELELVVISFCTSNCNKSMLPHMCYLSLSSLSSNGELCLNPIKDDKLPLAALKPLAFEAIEILH